MKQKIPLIIIVILIACFAALFLYMAVITTLDVIGQDAPTNTPPPVPTEPNTPPPVPIEVTLTPQAYLPSVIRDDLP